jgi:septation ring formation regulator EzrA
MCTDLRGSFQEPPAAEERNGYWACRSCLSFAQKVNTQFRGVAEKIDEVENRTVQNSYRIIKIQKSVDELERRMQRMERRMEEERQDIEDILYEELRER